MCSGRFGKRATIEAPGLQCRLCMHFGLSSFVNMACKDMGLPEYGMWALKSSSLMRKIMMFHCKEDYRILKEPTYIYIHIFISNRPEAMLLKDAKSTVEVDRNCQNDTTDSRYVLIAHGDFKVILEDT